MGAGSSEIAALRAEVESLRALVSSMRSDMDRSSAATASAGGSPTGGHGTAWAVAPGYMLPGGRWSDPHPFDIETDESGSRLVRCAVVYNGREYAIGDSSISLEGSVWVVKEEGEDGKPSFSISQEEPGDGDCAIRLYEFGTDGDIVVDHRHSVVSFWSEEESSDSEGSDDIVADLERYVTVDGKDVYVSVRKDDSGKTLVGLVTDGEGGGESSDDGDGDPCSHPESEGEGGVPASAERDGFGPGIGWSGGDPGVEDDGGGSHPGNPCNC